jgi:hypothetical protein
VPDLGDHSLSHELLRLWPLHRYVVSFVTIGIIWVNHHTVLDQLHSTDRTFLFINVFFLLCIAFIPFPTRLLATYVRTDDGQAAAVLYGITLTTTAVFFNLMWRYAIGAGGRLLVRTPTARRGRDHAELQAGRRDVRRRHDRRLFPGGGERRPLRCDRVVLRALQLALRPRGRRDVTIDTRVEIRELSGRDVLSLRPELAEIWPDASRARIDEILPRHVTRDGFRFLGAFADDRLVGFVYGYRGGSGQWWHDRVARALGAEEPNAGSGRDISSSRSCTCGRTFTAAASAGACTTSSSRDRRPPPSRRRQTTNRRSPYRARLARDRPLPRLRLRAAVPDHGPRSA